MQRPRDGDRYISLASVPRTPRPRFWRSRFVARGAVARFSRPDRRSRPSLAPSRPRFHTAWRSLQTPASLLPRRIRFLGPFGFELHSSLGSGEDQRSLPVARSSDPALPKAFPPRKARLDVTSRSRHSTPATCNECGISTLQRHKNPARSARLHRSIYLLEPRS